MTAIWSAENRFRIWFEIEAHATDALAELGTVPKSAAKALWDWWATNPVIDVAAIDAIEAVTKHDVIAFLTWVSENVGEEARFMHQGMTSSDVLDTCLAVQLAQSADLLIADLDALLAAIKRRAFEHKLTPTIGRSHGIHAEPVTFGLKLAQAYAEFDRCKARLIAARAEVATCAISGAVGTFANIDPRVEAHVAAKLGLAIEPVSTQVIPRDRHAMFFATLGVIAGSIERLATEVRHLQRTEVLEAEEYFSPGQKGSSAMPHKRNPVLTENLTGLARMVRSAVGPALENVALWHERDISHSSVGVTGHLEHHAGGCDQRGGDQHVSQGESVQQRGQGNRRQGQRPQQVGADQRAAPPGPVDQHACADRGRQGRGAGAGRQDAQRAGLRAENQDRHDRQALARDPRPERRDALRRPQAVECGS